MTQRILESKTATRTPYLGDERMRWINSVLLVGALLVTAEPIRAQANPDSVKLRNDCRLAEQVISTGQPAPHLVWANSLIGYCGRDVWARAAGAAIRRLRTSTDSGELSREWRHLWMLRDSDVFDAVREIAADQRSSVSARLWAFRTLANYIDPEGTYVLQPKLEPSGRVNACIANRTTGAPDLRTAKPLPTDFATQARDLAQDVATTASEAASIRAAAWCVAHAPVYGVIRDGTAG